MIAAHKGEIPFVVLLLPFIAGLAFGLSFSFYSLLPSLQIGAVVLAAGFILLNILYRRFDIYKQRWTGGFLIHLILFFAGWICLASYNELNHADHFSKKQADYLVIKISNEPAKSNGVFRFKAEVEQVVDHGKQVRSSGNLLVAVKDSAAAGLYYGDELLIPSSYKSVDPPLNPAEFNYKRYLANQNIHYQEFLYPGQYKIINKHAGNPIVAYSLRLRQRLVEKFKQNMHSSEAIAVASTLILGYKADLSNDVLQAYSRTGTIHVLSVSGAHVAILFILLEFAFSFLNQFKHGRTIKTTLIVLIIWYYALLTGFSPAVCRAAVMISMVIIGKTYNRAINTLNIMAISAFFLLLYDPLFLADVGFQLSYLAVCGLIILQPIVYKWFRFKNKCADRLWALCSVSIAAQVITFPLSAFYFHQFPVYFLISNLFIIIPSAIIMYDGIAYILLGSIPFLGKILGFILEKTILMMDNVLSWIEHTPFAGIYKIWITPLEYLLLYAVIIAAFYFMYDRKVWLLRTALVSALLLAVFISLKRWNNINSSDVTLLNLRKHKGAIVRNGDQAVVITDLSDTSKAYSYSIQPYLDSCQVSRIKIYPTDNESRPEFTAGVRNKISGLKSN